MLKKVFIPLLVVSAIVFSATKAYLDVQLDRQIRHWLQSYSAIAAIQYAQVYLRWDGALVAQQVQIKLPSQAIIDIEQLIFPDLFWHAYHFYRHTDIADVTHLQLKQLHFALDDSDSPAPLWLDLLGYQAYYLSPHHLQRLGYNQIRADIDLTLTRQAAQQFRLFIDANAHALGQWQLATELHNVPAPPKWQHQIQQIAVAQMGLHYRDTGFLPKALRYLAQRQQQSLTQLQQQLINQLNRDINALGIRRTPNIPAMLATFVENPRQLIIKLNAEPALSWQGIEQNTNITALLGSISLQVEAQ